MCDLSALVTQNELDDTGSTGDAQEYGRDHESENVIVAGALFALSAMWFWLLTLSKYVKVKAWLASVPFVPVFLFLVVPNVTLLLFSNS